MKNVISVLVFSLSLVCFFTNAQVVNPKNVVKRQGTNRTNNKIDQEVDKGFDKLEEGIGGLFGKKKNKKGENETTDTAENKNSTTEESGPMKMDVQWSSFDFVPGDEVIFEDGPDIMEENGEFPSRWDLIQGQVEIAKVNGENVIMFLDGGEIIPYLEFSNEDYLPDVFTIEFDYYTPKDGNRLSVYLTDKKNNPQSSPQEFEITPIRVNTPSNGYIEHPERDYSYYENGCWTHVSLAYTKGKLKVYLDDTRLVNIPRYTENPTGFTFYPYFADASEQKAFYAKNFRIAKGGVKYYDRVMTDGKIICNGIRFDVNKATLKPESMGSINKIYELMTKNPELQFSVEGHTDADGDDTKNQTLSEQRAKAVVDKLIAMGITVDRLSSKGFGEGAPLDNNNTPEGKANNRRVEFVKK
jgi:outer membrane protein OmpA-like peptidoglycan-associated protein